MKHIYFTVGPSQMYPGMDSFLSDAYAKEILSMSHRSKQFSQLYQDIEGKLKKLLGIPNDYAIFVLSSGTEGMERVLQNCVDKASFHILTGSFGKRFFETAKELGKSPIAFNYLNSHDLVIPETELIAVTENDTSTGVAFPMDILYAYKKKHPKTLIAVDVVSSIPSVKLAYSELDCVFFSVQKGFGLPAGLGVLIVSPLALDASSKLACTGSYHSFRSLAKYRGMWQTPETPNVLGMYLFNRVLDKMLAEGIETIRHETNEKAGMLYNFFDSATHFSPFVKDPALRSSTTLVLDTPNGSKRLLETLAKLGYVVGSGYGEKKEVQIRLANFPAHHIRDVRKLISCMRELDK